MSAHDVTEPRQQSTEQSVLMATIQAYTFYYPFYRSRNGAPEKRTAQVHTVQISDSPLTHSEAPPRRARKATERSRWGWGSFPKRRLLQSPPLSLAGPDPDALLHLTDIPSQKTCLKDLASKKILGDN